MNNNLNLLRGVLGEMRLDLLERENVVATGIGYKVAGGERTGTLSIICSVVEKLPEAQLRGRALIPREVGVSRPMWWRQGPFAPCRLVRAGGARRPGG